VADERRFAAQFASREADVVQAKTLLRSNELAERRSGGARRYWSPRS
jgi:hypothetical protein